MLGKEDSKIRCYCCDNVLTDYETSLVNTKTGEYEDTCLKCLKGLSISVKGNPNLLKRHESLDDDLPQDDDWFDFEIPEDDEEE